MKKLLALLMVLTLGLTACGNSQARENSAKNASAASAKASTANAKSTLGKTLVVYYSATGNTENVAKAIANETNADMFKLEPATPYSNEDLDWRDRDSRVSKEHDDESLRDVKLVSATPANLDKYDTIFVGYPIWWGIAAWPVNEFIKTNDFTGKTVIPFATSTSSGFGESGELLKEMAGTGNWQDGERFRSGISDDVAEWVRGLSK